MPTQRQPLHFFYLWFAVGAAMWIFIIYSSLTPHPVNLSGWKFSDKILHFSGYFGVMAWFAQLYLQSSIRIKQMILFSVMGIMLELSQLLVNERSFEWADMLANVLGVFAAWLLFRGRWAAALLYCERYLMRVR